MQQAYLKRRGEKMAFILNDVVPWGRNIWFKKDYHVKILPTEYEFQKGANKLLVIKN